MTFFGFIVFIKCYIHIIMSRNFLYSTSNSANQYHNLLGNYNLKREMKRKVNLPHTSKKKRKLLFMCYYKTIIIIIILFFFFLSGKKAYIIKSLCWKNQVQAEQPHSLSNHTHAPPGPINQGSPNQDQLSDMQAVVPQTKLCFLQAQQAITSKMPVQRPHPKHCIST